MSFLVWLDLGLKPDIPCHWWTIYSLNLYNTSSLSLSLSLYIYIYIFMQLWRILRAIWKVTVRVYIYIYIYIVGDSYVSKERLKKLKNCHLVLVKKEQTDMLKQKYTHVYFWFNKFFFTCGITERCEMVLVQLMGRRVVVSKIITHP